jgi:hypothetical protein
MFRGSGLSHKQSALFRAWTNVNAKAPVGSGQGTLLMSNFSRSFRATREIPLKDTAFVDI